MSQDFNLLNLDEVADTKRTIQIKGVRYEVKEMSVQQMAEVKAKTEAAEKDADADEFEQIDQMVALLQVRLPECPEMVLRGLTITQLMTIFQWFSQPDPDLLKEAIAHQDEATGEGESSEAGK